MKKIITSAATAAALTTAVFAGTLVVDNPTNDKIVISEELLTLGAVQANVTDRLKYTAELSLGSTASEPGFSLEFTDGITVALANNLKIVDANTSSVVATQNFINGNQIIFATQGGASVVNGKSYYIVGASGTGIALGELTLNVPQNTTGGKAKFVVTDNPGVTTLDTVDTDVISTGEQFTATLNTKLSAEIDAASGFLNFVGSGSATSSTTDSFKVTYINNAPSMSIVAGVNSATIKITADYNLTAVGITSSLGTVSGKDIIIPLTAAESNGTTAFDGVVSLSGANVVSATNFVVSVDTNFTNGTLNAMDAAASADDFGKWTVYGYTAQIPNVLAKTGFETNFKFTNASTEDSEVYFTLRDMDGTVAKLDSVTHAFDGIKAGATAKYKGTELLALVTDAEFDKTQSYSLEVSIPVAPEQVYGFASLRNLTLGQFKDLPIYNTSARTY